MQKNIRTIRLVTMIVASVMFFGCNTTQRRTLKAGGGSVIGIKDMFIVSSNAMQSSAPTIINVDPGVAAAKGIPQVGLVDNGIFSSICGEFDGSVKIEIEQFFGVCGNQNVSIPDVLEQLTPLAQQLYVNPDETNEEEDADAAITNIEELSIGSQ